MMTKNVLSFLISSLLVVAPAAPQEEAQAERSEERQSWVTKVIKVEHADVSRLRQVLGVFGVEMKVDRELGVIAVHDLAERVASLEDAIRRLDVPPPPAKSVELTVYLLLASKTPNGDKLPDALSVVRREVEKLLGYQSFELWDSVVVRSREGGPGIVRVLNNQYDLIVEELSVTGDEKGQVIRLDQLQLQTINPELGREGPTPATIRTNVEVREGQKVVVGKANMGGTDTALIVVITARLVT